MSRAGCLCRKPPNFRKNAYYEYNNRIFCLVTASQLRSIAYHTYTVIQGVNGLRVNISITSSLGHGKQQSVWVLCSMRPLYHSFGLPKVKRPKMSGSSALTLVCRTSTIFEYCFCLTFQLVSCLGVMFTHQLFHLYIFFFQ